MRDKYWTIFSTLGYRERMSLEELVNEDRTRPGIELTAELDWYTFSVVPPFISIAKHYLVTGFEIGPLRVKLYVRWMRDEDYGCSRVETE